MMMELMKGHSREIIEFSLEYDACSTIHTDSSIDFQINYFLTQSCHNSSNTYTVFTSLLLLVSYLYSLYITLARVEFLLQRIKLREKGKNDG